MEIEPLNLKYVPKTTISNGVVQYETPNDMYLGVLKDFLENAKVISRKGRLYLSFKPYVFKVRNTSNSMITLPGSNYHDPIPWLLSELFDWLHGPTVVGGRSVLFDKHRRTVYPRGNGEDDWSYKTSFGLEGGQGQLDWARKHLSMDATSRSCVMSPWEYQRDLIKFTARKQEELNKGEEYQRLPCIASIQFSQDDTLEPPYRKGANIFCHQRALDFTGAIHTDLYRLIESAQWAASGAYPKGISGNLTCMAGTCVIESFGKQRFVEFTNLIKWWTDTPSCLDILDQYPNTNLCIDNPEIPNMPSIKSYAWFMSEWHKAELAIYDATKGHWDLFMQKVEEIEYQYYKDFAYSMAIFEWCLQEEMAPELIAYHWDAPQLVAAKKWADNLKVYPPFFFLYQIKNSYKYLCSSELVRLFIVRKDWENLNYLINEISGNKRNKNNLLMDASRFLNKRQRTELFGMADYKDFGELYNSIFEIGGEK